MSSDVEPTAMKGAWTSGTATGVMSTSHRYLPSSYGGDCLDMEAYLVSASRCQFHFSLRGFFLQGNLYQYCWHCASKQLHSQQFYANVSIYLCVFVWKIFYLVCRGNNLADFDELWQLGPS